MHFEPSASVLENLSLCKNGNPTSCEMDHIYSKQDRRKMSVEFEVECLSGIFKTEYGQSVHCCLDSPEADQIMEYEEAAAKIVPEGFEYKPFLQDDKFFLKLVIKDGKYKADITPPLSPEKYAESNFKDQAKFMLKFSPHLWINYSTKKAGLYLHTRSIVFGGVPVKKVKGKK